MYMEARLDRHQLRVQPQRRRRHAPAHAPKPMGRSRAVHAPALEPKPRGDHEPCMHPSMRRSLEEDHLPCMHRARAETEKPIKRRACIRTCDEAKGRSRVERAPAHALTDFTLTDFAYQLWAQRRGSHWLRFGTRASPRGGIYDFVFVNQLGASDKDYIGHVFWKSTRALAVARTRAD